MDVGVPGGERGNGQTGTGDRVSTISLLGCSTSVALATGPTDEEEVGESGRPHTLATVPTSSVLEFIVCEQSIMLLQVKFQMWVSSLPLTLTDHPASFKAARYCSRCSADCNCSTRQLLLHS